MLCKRSRAGVGVQDLDTDQATTKGLSMDMHIVPGSPEVLCGNAVFKRMTDPAVEHQVLRVVMAPTLHPCRAVDDGSGDVSADEFCQVCAQV